MVSVLNFLTALMLLLGAEFQVLSPHHPGLEFELNLLAKHSLKKIKTRQTFELCKQPTSLNNRLMKLLTWYKQKEDHNSKNHDDESRVKE